MERQERLASYIKNKEDFVALYKTGMLWEWFPECDGSYEHFIKLYKQKEENK